MRRTHRLIGTSLAIAVLLTSIAATAFLSLHPNPEREHRTVLLRAGDTVTFQGARGLAFEVPRDVTVTIRGQWTATVPTAVTTEWALMYHLWGWPKNLPKTLGGVIDSSDVCRTSLGGSGPVSCSLLLYSEVLDLMTAVTDIVVTYP